MKLFDLRLLPIFFVAATSTAFAAGQWSIRQCIDRALTCNIKVENQHLDATLQRNRYRQSKADLLPSVNGFAGQDFRFGRSVDPYTNGFRSSNAGSSKFLLDAGITIFDGFRTLTTIRRNRIDLMASVQEEERLKNEITMQVVEAYLLAVYNNELGEAARRQLENTQLQISRTQVLVDAGSVSRSNLYELLALAAQEDVEIIRAGNQESISLLTLQQILELDTLPDFAISPLRLPELSATDLDQIPADLTHYAMSLPEVKYAELAIQSARLDHNIESSRHLPSLTFNASAGSGYSDAYKKYRQVIEGQNQIGFLGSNPQEIVLAPAVHSNEIDYPFFDQIKDNANTTLSLQLTIPLFNRFQTHNAVAVAKINVDKKRLELEAIRKQVLRNIRTAFNDASAALHEFHGYVRACEASRESFRYIEEKFNVDMISSIDYHNGKNLLSKAESDLLQAKYKYFLKKSMLEILCDRPLSIK